MTAPRLTEEPSGDDFFRRITPPPGRPRRPGLLAVLLRWRMELLLALLVVGLWHLRARSASGSAR